MGFELASKSKISTRNSKTLACSAFNLNSGDVVSSTTHSITIDPGASAVDDEYNNQIIEITVGPGRKTYREITDYDGTGKVATVSALGELPDTNSCYVVHRHSGKIPLQDQTDRRFKIKLASHMSSIDNFFRKQMIKIVHKNGYNETRFIRSYDGTNQIATVSEKWNVSPNEGDVFIISGESGTATAATINTITVDVNHTDAIVTGMMVEIHSGTGNEQVRNITGIAGAVLTVDSDWTVTPDNTSEYRIMTGWVGTYESVEVYSQIASVISLAGHEKAVMTISTSTTSSKSGALYSRKELYDNPKATHTFPVRAKYMKLMLHAMGTSITGEIQTTLEMSQSNNISTIEEVVDDTTNCSITRSVLTGKSEDDGRYKNINTDFAGNLNVNIMEPRDNFGHVVIAEPKVMHELKFPHGTTHFLQNYFFSGSAGFLHSGCVLTPITGPVPGSVARLKSIHRTYDAGGLSMKIRFSALFSPPVAGCQQIIGYGDEVNGYFMGYNGTDFGVMRRSGGLAEIRVLTIVGGATSTGNVTVELDGNSVNVPVTSGDTVYDVARKIAKGVLMAPYYLQKEYSSIGGGWICFEDNNNIYFQAEESGARSGTYSISGQGVTGVWTPYQAGVTATDEWFLKSNWNVDRTDETVSLPVIDFSKGNLYEIDLQWLGFGNITFKIQNPTTGKYSDIHKLIYTNMHTTPNITVPHQPLMMEVRNNAVANSVSLSTTSMVSMTIGRDNLYNATRFGGSVLKKQTLQKGKTYNVLTLRNSPVLMGGVNVMEMMGMTISSSWNGTSSALFMALVNADLKHTLTPSITAAGTGYSVASDQAVTGGTGTGLKIDIDSVGGSGEVTGITVENHGSGYEAGDVVTLTGGNTDCTLTLDNTGLNWTARKENVSAAYMCEDVVECLSGELHFSVSMNPGTRFFETFNTMEIFMPPWFSLTLAMKPLKDEVDAEFSTGFFWTEKI